MICLVPSISGRGRACLLSVVFHLLAVLIFCCSTVAGRKFSCEYAYRTINQFKTISAVNISCYSNSSSACGVYYAPIGVGCDYRAVFIDNVDANTTKTLSHRFAFGGAFCTNFQIDATYQVNGRILQLPRASEAGYFFNKGFEGFNYSYRKILLISISALNSSAKVNVIGSYYPHVRYQTRYLKPFETIQFRLWLLVLQINGFRLLSDNPVVVSYTNSTMRKYYYNWRPIYTEPTLLFVPVGHIVELRAVKCSDNTDIWTTPRHNMLNVTTRTTNVSVTKCIQDRIQYSYSGYMPSFTTDCVVLATPQGPGICVSVSLFDSQNNYMLTEEMGSPPSRFATQLLGISGLPLRFSSVVNNTCTAYSVNGTEILNFTKYAAPEEADPQIYYGDSAFLTNPFDSIECEYPFQTSLIDNAPQNLGHLGRMSDSLWKPYFDTFQCQLFPPSSGAIATVGGMTWLIAICFGLLF